MSLIRVLPVVALAALSTTLLARTAGEGDRAAAPSPSSIIYRCDGDKKITTVVDQANPENPKTTISVDGDPALQNIEMFEVMSANGVKTSNGKLVWWTKGDEGFLAAEDPPAGDGEVVVGGCKETPPFDAELAQRLGGDEHGMKKYVLVILKTGPKDADFKDQARADIFAGHMQNIGRLAAEGKLAVAGPFRKNDRNMRGLYIFNVESVAEAEALVQSDPAVEAGVFIAEMTPWYGSASLMATPDIHKKIAKSAP